METPSSSSLIQLDLRDDEHRRQIGGVLAEQRIEVGPGGQNYMRFERFADPFFFAGNFERLSKPDRGPASVGPNSARRSRCRIVIPSVNSLGSGNNAR